MTKKHLLIMLACCLIPLVAFAAIFIFKIPTSSVVRTGLVLICPLGMLLMMKYMMSDNHDHSKMQSPLQLPGDDKERKP
jgi:ABC-type transport system involved in cytochrome bd biosynthesis fused ATPase/permease subunit